MRGLENHRYTPSRLCSLTFRVKGLIPWKLYRSTAIEGVYCAGAPCHAMPGDGGGSLMRFDIDLSLALT